ncbi:MAG: ATP-binding protein [Chloroflexota bacterium]|nr:ATP-binding protein [Chloroflexota bacterium]
MVSEWSIRRRLVLTVLLISSLVIGAAVIITLQSSAAVVRGQREGVLYTQSEAYAGQMNELITVYANVPRLIANMLSDPTLAPVPTLWRPISNILLDYPRIQRIGILRPVREGYQVYTFRTPQPGTTTAPLTDDFRRALPPNITWLEPTLAQDGILWSDVRSSRTGQAVRYIVSLRFRSSDAAPAGVVWIEMSAASLRQGLQDVLPMTVGEAYHLVVSADMIVGAYSLPSMMADRTGQMQTPMLNMAPWQALLAQMTAQSRDAVEVVDPLAPDAPAVSYVVRQPLLNNWQLVSVYSPALFGAPLNQNALLVLLLAALGLTALGVIVRNLVQALVSKPLMAIANAAQEIGSGDMRYHVAHTDRNDEVGALARSLAAMQQNLTDTYGRLSSYGRTMEQQVSERTHDADVARQQAEMSAAEMRSLYDASIDLVSEYNLDVMLQKLVQYIRSLLRAGYCSVWLLTDEGRLLKLVATTPEHRHVVGIVITANEGLAGRVTRTRKPLMLEDYTNWQGRIGWIMPQMHRALAIPLIYSGRAIGAVIAGRGPLDKPFVEAEQRLLILLANVVSPIVRNAQLFGQLDDAKKKSELASEVKTRFLAGITHELRTPLNLVINNMDFMRIGLFGDVTNEQRERLDQTIRSAEHLLYLINDLLDVSKIEAGEMQLFLQPTDLTPVVVDTLDAAIAMIPADSPVALLADFPEQLPELPIDARRIRQVLINLLSNAIKFTKQGEIWLRIKVKPDCVEFSVSDSGMGIPKEDMESIFRPFERTQRSKEQGIEGTGLGLAISRYLIEAHGGKLEVESEIGKGSTFRFALPLKQKDEKRTTTLRAAVT